MEKIKTAWDWTVAIYEWLADILAAHPKLALALVIILLVASAF